MKANIVRTGNGHVPQVAIGMQTAQAMTQTGDDSCKRYFAGHVLLIDNSLAENRV
jgi:hypothetical protein